MPFQIIRDDITHLRVDAIVNAANERLQRGGGVCGAIFAAAGAKDLQAACDKIGHCGTGQSVATPAFRLAAKHVIHTVGPIWHGGHSGEKEALASCYRTALTLAQKLGDESIAFPLISSGIYGYPKDQAIDVALHEIRAFLDTNEMDVFLIIFDSASLKASRGRFSEVAQFIDDQYVQRSPYRRRTRLEPPLAGAPLAGAARTMPAATLDGTAAYEDASCPRDTLEDMLKNLDASFSTTLLTMIDERQLKDSDVYKRANMSRQHFSKIRSNKDYRPKKQTVLALAIALKLTLEETRLLLERAGFALTHADERDVIVEFYIRQGTYDIYDINLALYAFDQPLLG